MALSFAVQSGDLMQVLSHRVLERLRRPLGRREHQLSAQVMQGVALVAAAAAGGAVWRSMKTWRSVETVAALQRFCQDTQGGRWLRFSVGPVVQVICVTNGGDDVTGIPAIVFTLKDLRLLDLSGCAVRTLPPVPSAPAQLRTLRLSRCGLTELPAQISCLRSLHDLDVSGNQLAALPAELGSLQELKYLNVMGNSLRTLPPELGQLVKLSRLGLKDNQLEELPEAMGGMTALVELFITNNKLRQLPASMASLTSLVKLQASFNELEELPAAMGSLPRLELMRVACNRLRAVPDSFAGLDALAWFSLGGNPACAPAPPARSAIVKLVMDVLQMGNKLGDGASGEVFAATLEGQAVAVKIFKSDVSPDGRAADEIAVTCAVDHPALIKVVGAMAEPHALVVVRVDGSSLAEKPNLVSLLRCRWGEGRTLAAPFVLRAATDVASALAYLHARRICHGDVYAHNVLAADDGAAVLCDYGASFFYNKGPVPYEAQEVRAFGLFLMDMVKLIPRRRASKDTQYTVGKLQQLADACTSSPARTRMLFAEVYSRLSGLSLAMSAA